MKTKSFFLLFLVCIFSAFFTFAPFGLIKTNAKESENQPKVYITNTGNCYHGKDCHYLQSKIPIGLYDAKEQGYSECSYCGGEPDGYYSWQDYENYLNSIAEQHKGSKTTSTNNDTFNGWSTFWIIFFVVIGIAFIYTEFIAPDNSKKK